MKKRSPAASSPGRQLHDFLDRFTSEHNISERELAELFSQILTYKKEKDKYLVPLCIFRHSSLSSLEIIIKYLREEHQLRFSVIAQLTGRNEKSLAVTYRNAKKKQAAALTIEPTDYSFPVSILQDRGLSVLEHLVCHLKEKYSLTYHQIASILHRNDRTVWTVYQRALKKRRKS